MKKLLIISTLLTLPSLAQADNYATCILDKLEGAQNYSATVLAVRLCNEHHPEGLSDIKWGSGRGFFAPYDSYLECFQDKSKSVQVRQAIGLIASACDRLYGDPPKPAKRAGLFDDLRPKD
ncbi:hypothetical protein ACYCFL_05550 [Stutzerimonas nitrititolerans]|uniref:hypothetical protein n=1 Tax=Stutzerimonas nitrititolerans TaxID=2482751 RepID=UPI0028A0070E|nr:hypothetical protein [Stutzerimonas nitrititolerans]